MVYLDPGTTWHGFPTTTTCYGLCLARKHRKQVISPVTHLISPQGRRGLRNGDKAKVVVGRRDTTCYGEKSFSSPLPCQEKSKIDNQSCRLSHLIPFLPKERSVKGSRRDGDKSERRQRTLLMEFDDGLKNSISGGSLGYIYIRLAVRI